MDTVVEIGPGTGRYLARVRELAKPRRHVVYETAEDWRVWLAAEYGVETPPAAETLSGVDHATWSTRTGSSSTRHTS